MCHSHYLFDTNHYLCCSGWALSPAQSNSNKPCNVVQLARILNIESICNVGTL